MIICRSIVRTLLNPNKTLLKCIEIRHNYELRIAGGAVRDLLLGKNPSDVDFATTATPDEMDEMFEKEGVRTFNKRGREHGTVTCRINDKENFEITTLRIDRVCDGRRAEVEFTTDWYLDANRRDLTVNSLFLDLQGTVYDYFNGVKDLEQRRILFVRDAQKRIQEDYLRILRYFRFYGRLAKNENAHDQITLQAITNNAQGLSSVSGERIWMELKKIVVGNHANSLLKTMINQCKIAQYCGLPTNPNFEVSAVERRMCLDLVKLRGTIRKLLQTENEEDAWKFVMRVSFDVYKVTPESKAHIYEMLKYFGATQFMQRLQKWQPGNFPANGYSVAINGVPKGPMMKLSLEYLFNAWFESDFKLSDEQLFKEHLPIWLQKNKDEIAKNTSKQRKLTKKN